MDKIEKIYCAASDCPVTTAIEVIGGKWKPIIIWLLIQSELRFGELHKAIPVIALKVLSRQLKELEADGIIIRTAYPEVPPRVVYRLSEKGRSLSDVMQALSDWSRANLMDEVAV